VKTFSYLFPFFFAGLFVVVIYVLSKKGWADLVSSYRRDHTFVGKRIGIISAGINGLSYSNCLLLKYNEEGIYIRPILIFRLFHPPVMIPWTETTATRDKKILGTPLKELVIGDPAVVIMQLRKKAFDKIADANNSLSNKSWNKI